MYFDAIAISHSVKKLNFPEPMDVEKMKEIKGPLPNHFFVEDDLSVFFPINTNLCYQHMTFVSDIISKQYDKEPGSQLSIDVPAALVMNILNIGNEDFAKHYQNKDVNAVAGYVAQVFEFVNFQDHSYEVAISSGEPLEIH